MNPLATILDKDKCIGTNFLDWRRKLRVVLNSERIGYVLDNEPPKPLADEATAEERQTHKKWEDDELKVRSYIKAYSSSQLLVELCKKIRYPISDPNPLRSAPKNSDIRKFGSDTDQNLAKSEYSDRIPDRDNKKIGYPYPIRILLNYVVLGFQN
ncbi:hypothetical protein Patl1_20910 [Pistacia atlantica]|uniref:Uncharacterized protein n=1 Tax=Pistacia atlantica TaxID=434234 RepID=A0ACC1BHF9_9ROSI|nr:hypothetical protein Patl1_20910 [Pistacia atlantica]